MKNKKAISLIVLVITILVLSILATSVIVSLSNTNIIEEASDAVKKTEAQQIEEMKALMYTDGIMGYNPEPVTIGVTEISWNDTKKKVIVKRENVLIPSGFNYVEGTKDTGMVIEDVEENQFVWVPVEYEIKEGEVPDTTTGLYKSFTDVFKRGEAEETSSGSGIYKMTGDYDVETRIEPYNSYAGAEEDYYKMCKSVQYYHGFYIARFEAGDGEAKKARTGTTDLHKVVSKKGAFVYNYVPWGKNAGNSGNTGAVYLASNMYANHQSVVSTLCYGVQWDAIMNFVSDKDHNIINSTSWGNCLNSEGAAKEFSGVDNMDYTTGRSEAWKAKNIYDLAGNVVEFTMEIESDAAISRGGWYSQTR